LGRRAGPALNLLRSERYRFPVVVPRKSLHWDTGSVVVMYMHFAAIMFANSVASHSERMVSCANNNNRVNSNANVWRAFA